MNKSLPCAEARDPKVPVIPYGRQSIGDEEVAAVVAALRSDWLTCGPAVERLEQELASACGAKHAVAVSNGTAALHVAMLAAGVQPGERVLTSPNTFLASANCAEFVGARADFVDIDPSSLNIDASELARVWSPEVKAVVAVDFAGRPSDMPAIHRIAKSTGAWVIEDAAHSLGSSFTYEGTRYRVGGHAWADMTTFSFHPVKTITTAEGGAIVTDDDKLARRCRRLRSHGMIREPGDLVQDPGMMGKASHQLAADEAPWYYEMQELGYNYRITDLQCALGVVQLTRLKEFVRRRHEIVHRYDESFADLAAARLTQHAVTASVHGAISFSSSDIAWHLYVLQVDFARLGKTRSQVMKELRSMGVGTQVHYIPVHLQPYYREKYGYAPGKCPRAEEYYSRALSLPLYPAMTEADVSQVISAVLVVLQP